MMYISPDCGLWVACKIVHHQFKGELLILLTFLKIVRQRKGPKLWLRSVHQLEYTLPCPSQVYQNPWKYLPIKVITKVL